MINWKAKAFNAQPITEFPVHDCHNHLGKWNIFHVPQGGTIEQMIATMDIFGIDTCFVTSHSAIGPDYVFGNNMVMDAMDKYPDRVRGYVTLNPNYPDEIEKEISRCFANGRFLGIKLHPDFHRCSSLNPNYEAAYEYANNNALPVLIHVWGEADVSNINVLSQRYPNIRFIMGHTGASPSGMELAIKVINSHDNVYGDTALSMSNQGNIEWLLSKANPKRILFGSDMPYYAPTHTIGRIAMAKISDELKADVFGENLTRILNKTDF